MKSLQKIVLALVLALVVASAIALAGGLYTNGLPGATSITGLETIPADTNLPAGLNPQTEAVTIDQLIGAAGGSTAYSANSATASTTATAAQVTGNGGFTVLDMTGTLGAAGNLTTPTAAAIIAALPNTIQGGKYVLRVINRTAATNAWTVVGGTGVTVTGTATVAAAAWVDFVVTLNQSAGTVGLQRIGAGTN